MDSVFFKVTLKDGESIKVDNWDIPHFYSFNHLCPLKIVDDSYKV